MKKRFYNGIIRTMDTTEEFSSMLIENDRILMVGTEEETRQADGACVDIDLKGNTILPGFVDAHSHFTQTAMSFLQVSVKDLTELDEIQKKIQAFAQNLPEGEWIQVKDYDHNCLTKKRHPTLAEIDSFLLGHPLVLQHSSGHLGIFNSEALKRLGITNETPDPEGGKYGRDAHGLTGYMEENAYFEALKKMPMPSPTMILEGYRKAQELYASYGITTVQEGMMVEEMIGLYKLIRATGELKLDLVVYPDQKAFEEVRRAFPEIIKGYDKHIKLGGLKIFLDGSPQGRTAWMTKPYEGEETYRGYGTMTDEQVEAAQKLAGEKEIQLLAHCNGDAAAEQYLSCMEKAQEQYPKLKSLRPVMIHAQFLRPDQMKTCKNLGVLPSFFVAHVYHWGDVHFQNMGASRAEKMSAAASALENHLTFTFHQDTPVIPPDMFETIWCAVNRVTKGGKIAGADERISVFEAFKAVTINSAYQYFEEKEKGTLSPNKKADFIIVDQDPFTIEEKQLREISVLETWKDGECIFLNEIKNR